MSTIYFHSPKGQAELFGSERAHMGCLCNGLLVLAVGKVYEHNGPHWSRQLLPNGCYMRNSSKDHYERDLSTYLHVGSDGLLIDGKLEEIFSIALNTALVMGGDVMKLMARLHGQCEIHCYVLGPNRSWLADIMERGLVSGICRKNQGWEGVIQFLRSDNSSPVVCSYSVCYRFPNRYVAELEDNDDGDTWYALEEQAQWDLAFSKLDSSLELKPENWDGFYFTSGINGFQLEELSNRSS